MVTTAWTARYQYTASNVPELPLLLWTCDDPMYPGPMKRIAYEYKPGGLSDPSNPDGTRPVYGQICASDIGMAFQAQHGRMVS